MKTRYFLFVPAVLAVLIAMPAVSSAQTVAPELAQASTPAPVLHAQLSPTFASSSSSSSNAFLYEAPAQGAAPAKAVSSPEGGYGGPFSGIGVGFKLGLAGIGFDVATPIIPTRLNLRGGATFFSYNLNDTTSDGETINGTLKLQNSGIMVDWFPFRGSFRLSGGVTVYNNKGLSGSANVADGKSLTLGNDKYYASGPLTGTADFKLGGNSGGRVSFGWGNLVPKPGHHFSFDTELGIEFVSAPTVNLAFAGNICTSAQGPGCESPYNASTYTPFLSDVTAEDNKLENDVNFVKFYPILSFGIGYKIH